jgi:hypothetical protein
MPISLPPWFWQYERIFPDEANDKDAVHTVQLQWRTLKASDCRLTRHPTNIFADEWQIGNLLIVSLG